METMNLDGREIHIYGNPDSPNVIIQPIDEHDLAAMEEELDAVRHLYGEDFLLVALLIKDWNQELTPWKAAPVFGKVGFGDKAKETLDFILTKLLPFIGKSNENPAKRYFLCGYSLAGLFCLWAAYESDAFLGIAAVSPSVWYPGWTEFASAHSIKTRQVYLSLGDKEEKAKNPTMARVGECIRKQFSSLRDSGVKSTLEWNEGNHFVDSALRIAKGIAWSLVN